MKEKDFKELKNMVQQLVHYYHLTGLKGLREHPQWRMFGENIDIRYAYREEKDIEKKTEELEKDIENHLVLKAEKEEAHILKKILKAIKHIYKAIFNPEIYLNFEVNEMIEYLEKIRKSRKLTSELKKMAAEELSSPIREWHELLRSIHNSANGIYAAAQGRNTVALSMTKVFHKEGADFFKRRQQKNLIKGSYKDFQKSSKLRKAFLKMDFKTKEEAKKELAEIAAMLKSSEDKYKKGLKLLFMDWETVDKNLLKAYKTVDAAVRNHELPEASKNQWSELVGMIIEQILKPYLHSINIAVNQLDKRVKDLEYTERKLRKAA